MSFETVSGEEHFFCHTDRFRVRLPLDSDPPSLLCPPDISTTTRQGLATAPITWEKPTFVDRQTVSFLEFLGPGRNGSAFPIGITTASYKARDEAGNEANCTITIFVQDDEDPVFSYCPLDLTVIPAEGDAAVEVIWIEPIVSDNSGSFGLSYNITREMNNTYTNTGNGLSFEIGSYLVIYEATDDSNNTAYCSFEFHVVDTEDPVIVDCPSSRDVPMETGQNFATVSWTIPTVSDNSNNVTLSFDGPGEEISPRNFSRGLNSLSYTAVDAAGNRATCMFDIVVFDNEDPVIIGCPSSQSVPMETGQNFATVSWTEPKVSDNAATGRLIFNGPGEEISPRNFSRGITSLSYTALDDAGNRATCMFEIVVIDTEDPVILGCPFSSIRRMETGQRFATVSWISSIPPTASDNSNNVTLSFDGPGEEISPRNFSRGITSLSYTAVDNAGNRDTCMFEIVVIDTEDPVIVDCPSSQSVPMETGQNFATVSWTIPTVSDNSNNVTLSFDGPGEEISPRNFSRGITSLSYTAVDKSRNIATCMFEIVVIDNEEPAILGCPSSQSVSMELGQNFATVSWTEPTVIDNADASLNINLTFDGEGTNPGNFTQGITSLSYIAEDTAGNKATCMFEIVVSDTEDPVIVGCPFSHSVSMELGQNFATVPWAFVTPPTASDNSDLNVTVSFDGPGEEISPRNFTQGITSLLYTAVDAAGNRASCIIEIVVFDTEDPVIVGCPSSQSVPMEPGQNFATVSWMLMTPPTASDNSNKVTLTFNGPGEEINPRNFSRGITSLSYTAADNNENRATCMFEIVVIDNEEPAILGCPSSQSVSMELGQNFATVSWTEPTVIDNADASLNINLTFDGEGTNPGNFTLGITSLSYTAIDTAGNRATCMFEIVVSDTEDPVIVGCPFSRTVPMETGQRFATVSWMSLTPTTASDNSNNVTLSFDGPGEEISPRNFSRGFTSLSYVAVDAAGNRATCMFQIVVIDTEDPVIIGCPSSQSVPMETGQNFATVSWTEPKVSDNAYTARLIFTGPGEEINPRNFSRGITSLSYTAVDKVLNRATCMFEIVVIDNEEPAILGCPSSQSVPMETGQNFATVFWTEPKVIDNADSSLKINLTFDGEVTNPGNFTRGITSLSYIAEDTAGNRATCMFEIVVSDTEDPVIAGCPSSQSVPMETGQNFATVSWTEPTVADNSNNVTLTFNGEGTNEGDFSLGIASLSYTAIDTAGNRATCMFEIVVSDTEDPVIAGCPSSQSVPMETGQNFATVSWTEPTVADNSNNVTLTFNGEGTNAGDFSLGINSLSYTAVDGAGNRATCMFEIVVSGRWML
eukprot:XP_011674814.1 PREDICTED: hyalin-like [Strongylocentrotus purpuratus]